MKNRSRMLAACVATSALLVAACGGGDESSDTTAAPATTAAPSTTEGSTETTEPADVAWAVDTSLCVDEAAATAPIEGKVSIGSVLPLTGGVAAAAFAPVKTGMEAYVKYANEKGLLGDIEIEILFEDDQYNAELTGSAVNKLIDNGVNLFGGILGTDNNEAVRDTLNDNCLPQLGGLTGIPSLGDPENYPWTTGQLPSYIVETKIYAAKIAELFPDGAKVAMLTANSEFGASYADTMNEVAGEFGITVVADEKIEATDAAPPTAQFTNIAAAQPDVVLVAPLGAQCPASLSELAKAKAANAGWEPLTFLTNTCASDLILAVSGAAADGIYTTGYTLDVLKEENKSEPGVAEYLAFMEAQGAGAVVTTAAAGWVTAETIVAILVQAAASPEGLTRASIINAARNFEFTSSLAVPGVVFTMDGLDDPFLIESLVVRQFTAGSPGTFTDVGELITDYES